MVIGIMLFFVVIGMTLVVGTKGAQPEDIAVSATVAYGPFFLTYSPNFVSPGYRCF